MSDKIMKNNNSINFIRLIAAIQVFLGHALKHFELPIPSAVRSILGVPVFFGISGFLLWESISKTKSFGDYAKKRILRIYPELWLGVLVNMVIMIVVYGYAIELIPFLAFQITQSTFMQFWTPDCLRGYGVGTPNGSLWTIGVMVQCYVVLWFIYKRLHQHSTKSWMLALFASVFTSIIIAFIKLLLPTILGKLIGQTFLEYLYIFLIGAIISEFFDKVIVYLKRYWWLFLLCSQIVRIININFASYGAVYTTMLLCAVIGFTYAFPQINIKVDLSYGIYIYHMIVINLLVEFGYVGKGRYVLFSFVASCLLSLCSYYTIGMLARNTKKRLQAKQ